MFRQRMTYKLASTQVSAKYNTVRNICRKYRDDEFRLMKYPHWHNGRARKLTEDQENRICSTETL